MKTLTRTQISVLLAYSSPFVLLVALAINIGLIGSGMSQSPLRLVALSAAFPIGLSIGRLLYLKKSHVEIRFDETTFVLRKGRKEIAQGNWRSYRTVSIRLDQYGRPNLRLYKSSDEEFLDLPISQTNARPQEFRNFVQGVISGRRPSSSLRVVEAA